MYITVYTVYIKEEMDGRVDCLLDSVEEEKDGTIDIM